MNFEEYISSISFLYVQPEMPLTPENMTPLKSNKKFQMEDVVNTTLPNEEDIKLDLYELCRISRMSTYAIAALINYGVSQMEPNTAYVNVGVWFGFTLLAGMIRNENKTCIGVDNFSQFTNLPRNPTDEFYLHWEKYRSPAHHFYQVDYQEYFSKMHQMPIGFYLYDGNHEYEHQLTGLQVAEPYLSKNSIILIDDTNFPEPREATLDFISKSRHHYNILLDKKTSCNAHPTFWNGIMILQKGD